MGKRRGDAETQRRGAKGENFVAASLRPRVRASHLPLVALVLAALAAGTDARGQDAWAAVSPPGESFTVRMPGRPETTQQRLRVEELKVSGRRYEAADDGASYVVLSLTDAEGIGERLAAAGYQSERFQSESFYLDAIAELAWEEFVRAEVEKYDEEGKRGVIIPPGSAGAKVFEQWQRERRANNPSMTYRREFELSGRPAREYSVRLRKGRGGHIYICADGQSIYVAAALGGDPQAASLKQFVDSFELKAETAAPAREAKADQAAGAGDGGAGVDHSRPFRPSEVTQRARVLGRPEPLYTESARKFGVTGIVQIRLVLGAAGGVERFEVVKGLPHALTLKAVEAAQRIKFEPAQKDGRPVAQYATIQYHFNVY